MPGDCRQPDQKFEKQIAPNILYKSHMDSKKLYDAIMSSEIVISRSGYSTIMDLSFTGKKAIFVPTPGQSEQEYLAEYHMKHNNFLSMSQKKFNLKHSINQLNNFSGIKTTYNKEPLIKEIENLIAIIS